VKKTDYKRYVIKHRFVVSASKVSYPIKVLTKTYEIFRRDPQHTHHSLNNLRLDFALDAQRSEVSNGRQQVEQKVLNKSVSHPKERKQKCNDQDVTS
jgi:hypothetical protein